MPLVVGGFRLTWKLPVEGSSGAADVGVGLPPLEGGTTISVSFPRNRPHENVTDENVDAHAVEGGWLTVRCYAKSVEIIGSRLVGGL